MTLLDEWVSSFLSAHQSDIWLFGAKLRWCWRFDWRLKKLLAEVEEIYQYTQWSVAYYEHCVQVFDNDKVESVQCAVEIFIIDCTCQLLLSSLTVVYQSLCHTYNVNSISTTSQTTVTIYKDLHTRNYTLRNVVKCNSQPIRPTATLLSNKRRLNSSTIHRTVRRTFNNIS